MMHDTSQMVMSDMSDIRSDRAVQVVFFACKVEDAVSFAREWREGYLKGCSLQKNDTLIQDWSMPPLTLATFP